MAIDREGRLTITPAFATDDAVQRVSIVRHSTAHVPFSLVSKARTPFIRHVNANVPVS